MVTDVQSSSISRLGIGVSELGDHEATSPERYSGSDPFRQHDSCSLSETTRFNRSRPLNNWVFSSGFSWRREVLSVGLSRSKVLIVITTASLAGGPWTRNGCWTIRPSYDAAIWGLFQRLFITRNNTRLPKFVSPVLDHQTEALDAFRVDWKRWEKIYLFSTWTQIPKVLNRLQSFRGQAILLAPRWPARYGFRCLVLS